MEETRSIKKILFIAALISFAFILSACSDIDQGPQPSTSQPPSAVNEPDTFLYTSPYKTAIERLGGTAVFGQPLGDPFIASDGNMEQPFAKVVVYSPKDNPSGMKLRPLSKILAMPETAPGPKLYDRRQNVIFYPVDGELGYHVPIIFDAFIAAHGGQDISGHPISEAIGVSDPGKVIARQCFENYCLEFNQSAPAGQNIYLTDLGKQYVDRNNLDGYSQINTDNSVVIQVSTEKDKVTSKQSQKFYVLAYHRHTMEPSSNVVVQITLALPDGQSAVYETPPTGANGWVSMQVPPLKNIPNSTVVAFKACPESSGGAPVDESACASQSFLIWNYQ